MMKFLKLLKRNKQGAALVEFSLILPLIMFMTLGLVEGGYILYQFNMAQKATQIGAELASTRGPVVTGLTDCGVATAADAGTDCSNVAGASSWTIACQGGSAGANCDTAVMNLILTRMQAVYPNVEIDNLRIEFSGTGLGYVGRGKPVPAITVSLVGLQYDYIALGQLINAYTQSSGPTSFNITTARTTVIGEDLGDGTG